MNIIFAVEVVGINLFVVDAFYLDCGVEQSILASAKICHCGQGFQRLAGLDVHRHRELALGKRPQVHIMDIDDICLVLLPDILFELASVDVLRGTLHHNIHAVL